MDTGPFSQTFLFSMALCSARESTRGVVPSGTKHVLSRSSLRHTRYRTGRISTYSRGSLGTSCQDDPDCLRRVVVLSIGKLSAIHVDAGNEGNVTRARTGRLIDGVEHEGSWRAGMSKAWVLKFSVEGGVSHE